MPSLSTAMRSALLLSLIGGAGAMVPTPGRAQGFDMSALCKSVPAGVKRAGCLQDMRGKQAMISESGETPPAQLAEAIGTVSLQAVLALDTTMRHWEPLAEWAWDTSAHRPSFHAIDSMLGGGAKHPPQVLDCPGGGSLGLVDNAGGARTIASQHSLPAADIAFEKGCRFKAGDPAVTAVAPSVEYTTQMSVPDSAGKQLVTRPMFLMFNSQPRLDSMPAWIPQGTAGEIRMSGGHLMLYAETPAESQTGFEFALWPKQAHAVDHRPYVSIGLRTAQDTPGVGAAHCIADGRRCLMLDTNPAAPDRVIAHFDLSGSGGAWSQASPHELMMFLLHVTTAQPLAFTQADGGVQLASGSLVVTAESLPAGQEDGTHWKVTITPKDVDGKPMLHMAWQHGSNGAKTGELDVPQARAVSLPHYCGAHEISWACVDADYYPDWED